MTLETVPKSVRSDGTFRVAAVPSADNALSVAKLTAVTTKAITYSLTPTGYNRSESQEATKDERLTLAQVLEQPGAVTTELEVQYVYGDAADVAQPFLTEGTSFNIVERRAVDNATDWTVGQKVDVIPVLCGKQRKDPPTKNGVWTITQKLFITGPVLENQTLIA